MVEMIKELANFFINAFSLFVNLFAENAIKLFEIFRITGGGDGAN